MARLIRSRPAWLALLLLWTATLLWAEDSSESGLGSGYEFSMATGLGLLYGASRELVYKNSLSDSLLSELYWPMQPLAYSSASLYVERIAYGPRFFASFGLKSGFYSRTGTMTDKDWTTTSADYTHFSAHDCYTERSLFVDLALGVMKPLSAGLSLSYQASFSVMSFLWTARDGYLLYPPDYIETPVWGTGISYEQLWLSLTLGLGLDWSISERVGFSAAVLVTPLVYAADQDSHFLRLERFNEQLYGAFGVDPSLSLQVSFTERLGALVKISYRGIWGARGDTVHTVIGAGPLVILGVYENGAGASYDAVDIGFSLVSKL